MEKMAVSNDWWRWMGGMKLKGRDARIVRVTDLEIEYVWTGALPSVVEIKDLSSFEELPDLCDPATLGCMKKLVMAKYGCLNGNFFVTVNIQPDMSGATRAFWKIVDIKGRLIKQGRLNTYHLSVVGSCLAHALSQEP